MKRSGIRRGTGGLNRSSALGRTSAIARKSRAVARQVERDWRDARAKVDREGRCRACGAPAGEAKVEFGINWTPAFDDSRHAITVDIDRLSELVNAQLLRFQKFANQQLAGMLVLQPVRISDSR